MLQLPCHTKDHRHRRKHRRTHRHKFKCKQMRRSQVGASATLFPVLSESSCNWITGRSALHSAQVNRQVQLQGSYKRRYRTGLHVCQLRARLFSRCVCIEANTLSSSGNLAFDKTMLIWLTPSCSKFAHIIGSHTN